MIYFILELIRRHIMIALLLPVAIALTGAALHHRDLDDDYAVTRVAALMRTVHQQSNNGGAGQVQSFGQIANRLASAIHAVTP